MSTIKKQKKIKRAKISDEIKIKFLSDALEKCLRIQACYEWRANIIIGISSLIFIYSLTNLFDTNERGTTGFLIISFFCLVSLIFSLYSLKSPQFYKKIGLKESILQPSIIIRYSKDIAAQKYKKLLSAPQNLIDEYILEIYNISASTIQFKKKLSRLATHTLVTGLVIGFILLIFLP